MSLETPASIERVEPAVMRNGVRQPISPAVITNARLVFVSGQVPIIDGKPAAPDIRGQTFAALDMVEDILKRCNVTLAQVVKTTVWLTDAADYPDFNAAYQERFDGFPPARSTVISGLIAPVRIEIEAVAAID